MSAQRSINRVQRNQVFGARSWLKAPLEIKITKLDKLSRGIVHYNLIRQDEVNITLQNDLRRVAGESLVIQCVHKFASQVGAVAAGRHFPLCVKLRRRWRDRRTLHRSIYRLLVGEEARRVSVSLHER